MINASTVTQAVETLLNAGLPAKNPDYRIVRADYVNQDEDQCPWVGIYRGELVYEVATLGIGLNSWKADFDLRIIVQASSNESSIDAEERLEQSILDVLDVIMTDKQIGATVDMVDGVRVSYSYIETQSETLFFQEAELTISVKVRTQ